MATAHWTIYVGAWCSDLVIYLQIFQFCFAARKYTSTSLKAVFWFSFIKASPSWQHVETYPFNVNKPYSSTTAVNEVCCDERP